MADAALDTPAAFDRWIDAQRQLMARETPVWEDCDRLARASSQLSGFDPAAGFWTNPALMAGAGDFCAKAAERENDPNWLRFCMADLRLKSLLMPIWLEATAATPDRGSASERIAHWAKAMDAAHGTLVETEDYAEAEIEWLRAAIACEMRLPPENLIVPPDALTGFFGDHLPIARTPVERKWSDGKATLSRCLNQGDHAGDTPLLILHGLIGRQTVADLEPGRSLIGGLVDAGRDVWIVDWGNPGPEDADLGFAHYTETMLSRLVAEVHGATGQKPALLGICQGGLIALSFAALHSDRISGIALTGTPVDFHADHGTGSEGYLNRLARRLPRDVIEGLIAPAGLLSGKLTGALFQAMTPGRTFAKYATAPARYAEDPAGRETFIRMELWLADRPDLPGRAAREWLYDLYQDNALAEGRFRIGGRLVDLARISVPVLNIVGRDDHIVPPPCSRALGQALRREEAEAHYRLIETPTGHIGVFVSEKARQPVLHGMLAWLGDLNRIP